MKQECFAIFPRGIWTHAQVSLFWLAFFHSIWHKIWNISAYFIIWTGINCEICNFDLLMEKRFQHLCMRQGKRYVQKVTRCSVWHLFAIVVWNASASFLLCIYACNNVNTCSIWNFMAQKLIQHWCTFFQRRGHNNRIHVWNCWIHFTFRGFILKISSPLMIKSPSDLHLHSGKTLSVHIVANCSTRRIESNTFAYFGRQRYTWHKNWRMYIAYNIMLVSEMYAFLGKKFFG